MTGTRVAVTLLLLLPVAWQLPALVALAIVAALLAALVGYEMLRFGQARAQTRRDPAPLA